MIDNRLTTEHLRDCLAVVEPVDLLGMRLLRAHSPPTLAPTNLSRETLTAAVSEMIDYTDCCTATAHRLRHLSPVPVTAFPILEYSL